eukprot:6186931-Pleurochrysis_carterae.AAC.1
MPVTTQNTRQPVYRCLELVPERTAKPISTAAHIQLSSVPITKAAHGAIIKRACALCALQHLFPGPSYMSVP